MATPESKEKRSAIAREMKIRPYEVTDLITDVVTIYSCSDDAALAMGCARDSVHRAARAGTPSFGKRFIVKVYERPE